MDFKEANKTVHPVEKQWHYSILTMFGFEPVDRQHVGFIRSYRYEKVGSNKLPHVIICTTGCNSDYWLDEIAGKGGYWSGLRPHLEKLFEQVKEEENV